jgi:putative endonuclease
MAYRQEVGAAGEQAVADYYVDLGFAVLTRNWRDGRAGELDLVLGRAGVAPSRALIVACEVKTRSSDRFGSGLEAVTPDKQRRLRRLVSAWMIAHRDEFVGWSLVGPCDLRIDVASVLIDRRGTVTSIDVVEGAC